MAHMDDSSRRAGFHIIERVARGIAAHGGYVDALVECVVNDIRAHTLGTSHIAVRSALPGLRLDAFEIPVDIHVEILRSAFEQSIVFCGPIEDRCMKRSSGSEEEEEKTRDHDWFCSFAGRRGFFPNSDSLPITGNCFSSRRISSGRMPPGT